MKRALRIAPIIVALSVVAIAPPLTVGPQRKTVGQADAGPRIPSQHDALTPQARGKLARQFVLRWGSHVERVYDVKVGLWARRMVPTFVAADSANFRNPMKRATFEGAVAELMGQGFRLSDQRAVQRLVEASRTEMGNIAGKALGDLDRDLTYTPIQPCRILDTRNTVAGPVAAGATRSFVVVAGTYASQGGDVGDCGTTGVVPSAVALNVTAVTPDRAGYATVFPFGATQPLASSVNYTAGAIVNNAIITKVPNPLLASDFSIYSYGQAHYVVDIVGYFAAPRKTPLDCQKQEFSQTVNNGQRLGATLVCPSGYTVTGGGASAFFADGVTMNGSAPASNTEAWITHVTNNSGFAQTVVYYAVCCRVPGR